MTQLTDAALLQAINSLMFVSPDNKVTPEEIQQLFVHFLDSKANKLDVALSAYEIAVLNGYPGTVQEWLLSLQGVDGTPGASAYQLWLAQGNSGTDADFLASLQGPPGAKGDQGDPATNLVTSVNGDTGDVMLDKSHIGLSNVDNTSDSDKPVSAAVTLALSTKADLINGLVPQDQLPIPTKLVGNRLTTIGTSLIDQDVYGASNQVAFMSRSWLAHARAYSRGRFKHPVWHDPTVIPGWEPSGIIGSTRYFQGLNFGVSGQTFSEIEARLPYIKANFADKFDIIVVDAGTNDMVNQTKEDIQAARERICQYFMDMGKLVILLPILARAVSSWTAGSAARKKANWVNIKSRHFVKDRKNLYLYDWNKDWVDFNNVNGEPRTGHSNDGIHLAPIGGDSVGFGFAQFLATILPDPMPRVMAADDQYDAVDNPFGNIISNPFCLGSTNSFGTGASGVISTGRRVERSSGANSLVVCSKEVRADRRGEFDVLTFSVSGTAEELFYYRTATANTNHTLGGKWVISSCEIETNNGDGITGISLYVEDNNGTGSMRVYDMKYYSEMVWPSKNRSWTLETPALMLAADSTALRWRVEIRVKGPVTVQPVVKIGALELRQTNDPRT